MAGILQMLLQCLVGGSVGKGSGHDGMAMIEITISDYGNSTTNSFRQADMREWNADRPAAGVL
ncbi:hypothetical protein GCM10011430_15640 [Oxalicibacterium solurbis]|uniref:Uncharacterized protein n=1 Tax=Oxalicibacterium solurbis TaxID=69280 RepID=A0A8J3B3M6_9BURK|nr:hypothetical protein GCM10011430_15640 [Oxalicibacterium solurbis]